MADLSVPDTKSQVNTPQHTNRGKPQIYLPNKPTVTRLVPELAEEIGLNESIILLQIDFWISHCNNQRDGKFWTYQSVTNIQNTFKFWSRMTINRAIKSLEDKKLILVGNYNERKADKTRWFALNVVEINKLKSCQVLYQNDTGLYQNDTTASQNDTDLSQNDTTLPESSPKTTTEREQKTKEGGSPENVIKPDGDAWMRDVPGIHTVTAELARVNIKASNLAIATTTKKHGSELVLKAIEIAVMKDKRTWAFVVGCIQTFEKDRLANSQRPATMSPPEPEDPDRETLPKEVIAAHMKKVGDAVFEKKDKAS